MPVLTFVKRFACLDDATQALAANASAEGHGYEQYSYHELDEMNGVGLKPGVYITRDKWARKYGLRQAIEKTSYELFFHEWN